MLDVSSRINEALSPGIAAMEMACRHVTALGYSPADCLVIHESPYAECGARSEIQTLQVLGKPCFEVTTSWSAMTDDYRINITTYPRLIAWPEARPAHQLRASLTAGDP